jgi:polygalacturonase
MDIPIKYYALIIFLISISTKNIAQCKDSWTFVAAINDSIGVISFPDKEFNVMDYNAKADGLTNNTEAFKNAIDDCYKNGGGKVVIPAGKYLTEPIHLKNNVNLHLNKGAELLFSTNPNDYYPLVHTSFEGTELMNYSPLIYAYQCDNIAITGDGILNGQADISNWWPWCSKDTYGWKKGMPSQKDSGNRDALVKLAEDGVAVNERIFGNGHFLRPNFIEAFGCNKVLIEGIKIINAPFWVIHPIKCTNVIVDGVTVESHGPNNDGCDPEYSKNVIIRNCTFNTGDDCIAIKSGRDADGRRVAIKCENIVVQNCKMIDGHGGVSIGSEISAGVCNVFVENCTMDSPNLDRMLRIKTNSRRGGITENIYLRNIKVGIVKEEVLRLDMFYDVYGGQVGKYLPTIRNVNLENITVKIGGKYGVYAKGYKESPISNVTLKNVIIEKTGKDYSIENIKDLKFVKTYINGKLMKNP